MAVTSPGLVSFAVIGADGRLRGHAEHRTYPSASIVKAMLLAAELHRIADSGAELDTPTESLLTSMITYSDNDAATSIYARVGEAGLEEVAKQARMRDFDVSVSWGFARLSAGDMATFFASLDQVFPARYEKFAKDLLGSVIPAQSWGLPQAAPKWQVRFKGGWRETESGQLVHQAAELKRDGRRLAIAVLTDGQPSMQAGVDEVERIGALLAGN